MAGDEEAVVALLREKLGAFEALAHGEVDETEIDRQIELTMNDHYAPQNAEYERMNAWGDARHRKPCDQ